MKVNHNPIKNAVTLSREYFGTRWDYNDRLRIERAGYKPGFNVDGTGKIAYFKYVGCHGYMFFHLTVGELKAAKRLLMRLHLARGPTSESSSITNPRTAITS